MVWTITAGKSFLSFFLVIFLIYSTIATEYVCKFSKGCTQLFQSYFCLMGNEVDNCCRYKFSLIFLSYFFYSALLQLVYT